MSSKALLFSLASAILFSSFITALSSLWERTLLLQQSNDNARLSTLASSRPTAPIAPHSAQSRRFIVNVSIGSPPQTLNVAIDTSNDVAWFSCSGCLGCPNPAFDYPKSSTFKRVPCSSSQCIQVPKPSCGFDNNTCGFSNFTYGNSTVTAGLVQDTINLAGSPIPDYTFGCVQNTTGSSFPAQGLLGLGRGPLSLLSQTRNLYNSTFSYCLPSLNSTNFTGSLKLGRKFQPVHIKTTPLLTNAKRPSLYYVSLLDIRVGAKPLQIPPTAFALNNETGGGTIFDSGTMYTTLVREAYVAVRDELRRRQGNATAFTLGGFDTCYKNKTIVAPTITFMFDGMNTTLERENFIVRLGSGNISCLAMAEAKGGNSALNVIAAYQQVNHRILINGMNSTIGVSRETCSN